MKKLLSMLRLAALVCGGILMWALGMTALCIPPDLPWWRMLGGFALLGAAIYAWLNA